MYIYFDYSGNLKEIVSYPIRQGDINSKTIYVYVESSANPQMSNNMYKLPTNITAASIAFKLVDTDENLGDLNAMTKVSDGLEIPYDKNRDLKYFKYWKKYQFWKYTLQSAQTSANGVVAATVTLSDTIEDKEEVLDIFAFNIQASVGITPDSTMTTSQYQYLFSRITSLQDSLPSKALVGTFNTNNFAIPSGKDYYQISNITLNGSLNDLLIITWGNSFAICPVPSAVDIKGEQLVDGTFEEDYLEDTREVYGTYSLLGHWTLDELYHNAEANLTLYGDDAVTLYLANGQIQILEYYTEGGQDYTKVKLHFTTSNDFDDLCPGFDGTFDLEDVEVWELLVSKYREGHIVASMISSDGTAKIVRMKYVTTGDNKLQITTDSSFTPPANYTGYVINYKLV